MKSTWHAAEIRLLLFVALLLLLATLAPVLQQPAQYHAFADQSTWLGVPHALDVLSNLPFAMAGLIGLYTLERTAGAVVDAAERMAANLFFVGLLCTAVGSSYYHWAPDDVGLVVDRLAMTVAFAGLLGLVCAGRVSARAGRAVALALVPLGAVSLATWLATGNLLPWVLLQGGGLCLVLGLARVAPLPASLPVRWVWVMVFYALAKLLELADHQVYDLLGGAVSGHSLKHVLASLAAWPVIVALR